MFVLARPRFFTRMTRWVFLCLALAGCQSDSASHTPTSPVRATPTFEPLQPVLYPPDPSEVAVALASDIVVEDFAAENGLTLVTSYVGESGQTVALFDAPSGYDLEALREQMGVEAADPNEAVQLIEAQTLVIGFFEGDWDEEIVSRQSALASLDLGAVHEVATGNEVKVAVLDTGADPTHPWLDGHLQLIDDADGFTSLEDGNGIDDDGDGLIDEAYGHGTHVTGIVVTVAPGATILPIRVLNDDGIGSLYDILRGIDLALRYDVDLINLSLAMSESTELMEQLLATCVGEASVVVSAAGNQGTRHPMYPATSNSVVGVAAVDNADYLCSWSGAGLTIPMAAPGVQILSSYPGGEIWSGTGTSMATPVITGSIALVMEARGLGAREATGVLEATTKAVHPAIAVYFGRTCPYDAIFLD